MKTPSALRQAGTPANAVALALALTCWAAPALAQDASVRIDSFSYTTSGSTVLTWADPFQSFQATALNGGGLFGSKTDSLDTADYGLAIVGANVSNAQGAISTTTPQTFWATASATKSANPVGTPRNQGTALASQSGSFTLSAPGTVTFLIDYTLGVAKPGGNAVTDFASAFVHFNLGGTTGGGDVSDLLQSFAQLSGSATRRGEFSLTVGLGAGDTGFYTLDGSAQSFAVAAVPEPAEWALLSAGFAALVGFARRRKTRAA